MDIVDRIDELVADSLNTPEWRRSGYDNNINQDRCPNCSRYWHGLPITERIATMYGSGMYDPEYSAAEDDSPIICEGSEFIGPRRPPPPTPIMGAAAIIAGLRPRRAIIVSINPYTGAGLGMSYAAAAITSWRDHIRQNSDLFQWFHNLPTDPFDPSDWLPPARSDELPAHHPLRRRPPWNHRDGIKFGPRIWILEFRRREAIPLTNQYPRHTLWTPRGWTIPHQLNIAVWNLWPQFTAPEHQPPRPGYDFTALADHINTLPDWATTAWTPTHRPATAAAGRRARRTQPRGNR